MFIIYQYFQPLLARAWGGCCLYYKAFQREEPGSCGVEVKAATGGCWEALQKAKNSTQSKLKKHLPVADPDQGAGFLDNIKLHYETRVDDPEMSQEKLWYLATTSMRCDTKIKWLERWNQSTVLREAV